MVTAARRRSTAASSTVVTGWMRSRTDVMTAGSRGSETWIVR